MFNNYIKKSVYCFNSVSVFHKFAPRSDNSLKIYEIGRTNFGFMSRQIIGFRANC